MKGTYDLPMAPTVCASCSVKSIWVGLHINSRFFKHFEEIIFCTAIQHRHTYTHTNISNHCYIWHIHIFTFLLSCPIIFLKCCFQITKLISWHLLGHHILKNTALFDPDCNNKCVIAAEREKNTARYQTRLICSETVKIY